MDMEQLPEYIQSLNRLKDQYADKIEILCGLEVDYPPSFEAYFRMLTEMPGLDLLILGQHFYINPDGSASYENEDRSHEAAASADSSYGNLSLCTSWCTIYNCFAFSDPSENSQCPNTEF